jgi:hypothetical protein
MEPLELTLGPDLTHAGSVCKAKALLSCLSPVDGQALECYKLYLNSYVLVDPDQHLASLFARPSLREQIVAQQFKLHEPLLEPNLFSFFSFPCIARLGKCLGVEIVVYRLHVLDRDRNSGSSLRLLPVVDFRAGDFTPEEQKKHRQIKAFVFHQRGGGLHSVDLGELDRAFANDWLRFFPFPETFVWKHQDSVGFLHVLDSLVSREHPSERRAFVPPDLATRLQGPFDLLADPSLGRALWELWNRPVLLVAFEALKLSSKAERRNRSNVTNKSLLVSRPGHFRFKVLAYAGPVESPGKLSDYKDLESALVVGLWTPQVMSTLNPQMASRVKEQMKRTSGLGERLVNKSLGRFAPVDSRLRAKKLAALASAKSSRVKKINSIKKWCKCKVCRTSNFDDNMSKAGPERLVTTAYTPLELLEMLGIGRCLDRQGLLDRLGELSVGCMDIESRTVQVDLSGPRPGPNVPYSEIDEASLEAHVLKVQKPVMIAHSDGAGRRCLLQVKDDSEEAIFQMMEEYWKNVLHAQTECSSAKADLVRPLLAEVGDYKRAFFNHCRTWKAAEDLRHEEQVRRLKEKIQETASSSSKRDFNASSADPVNEFPSWDSFLVSSLPSKSSNVIDNNNEDDDDDDDDDFQCSVPDPEDDGNDNDHSKTGEQQQQQQQQQDPNASSVSDWDSDMQTLYEAGLQSLIKARPKVLASIKDKRRLDLLKRDRRRNSSSSSSSSNNNSNNGPKKRKGKRRKKHSLPYDQLCLRAWSSTLFGQLEMALLKLVKEYVVFSFYG